MTLRLYVDGVGFWAPGFRDAVAWGGGAEDDAATDAPGKALAPAQRRRATLLSRMTAEVAAQAAEQAGRELGSAPLIFGSVYGEIETAVEMIRSFEGPVGLPSPTRFHNSVHNTAVGYLSIATGNRGFVTSLAAGRETAAAVLLEAAALLASEEDGALVLFADESVPAPLAAPATYRPAAAALYLSRAASARTIATVGAPSRGAAPTAPLDPRWSGHPCAGALALVRAIARGERGPLGLTSAATPSWRLELLDRP